MSTENDRAATQYYDLRGLKCPLPAIKAEKRLTTLAPGTVLKVETTDPLAIVDIPHLCNQHGHRLISLATSKSGHIFVIEAA